jgi:hypothetical protein
VVPAYFLRLMADGRKLRSKICYSQADPVVAGQECEPALITSDYPAWMAHPFVDTGEAGGDDLPFRQGKIEFPGPDQTYS